MPRFSAIAWATLWLNGWLLATVLRTSSSCSRLLATCPSPDKAMPWPTLPLRIHCWTRPWPSICSIRRAWLPSSTAVALVPPCCIWAMRLPSSVVVGTAPSRTVKVVTLRAVLPSPATCTACTRPVALARPLLSMLRPSGVGIGASALVTCTCGWNVSRGVLPWRKSMPRVSAPCTLLPLAPCHCEIIVTPNQATLLPPTV